MECYSYNGGCGIHVAIETFKRRAGLAYRYVAKSFQFDLFNKAIIIL